MTGLAKDLLSAGPLGQYALLYLAAGAAIARMRPALDARSALTGAALAWAAAFAHRNASPRGRSGAKAAAVARARRVPRRAERLARHRVRRLALLPLPGPPASPQGKARSLRASYDEVGGAA